MKTSYTAISRVALAVLAFGGSLVTECVAAEESRAADSAEQASNDVKPARYRGVISVIDPLAKAFAITAGQGRDRVLVVTSETALTAKGVKINFADLKVGSGVAGDCVLISGTTHRAISVDSSAATDVSDSPAEGRPFGGELMGFDPAAKTITMKSGDGINRTLYVSDETLIEKDGAKTDFAGFTAVAVGSQIGGKWIRIGKREYRYRALEVRTTGKRGGDGSKTSRKAAAGEDED
jgi:hypothetical protein